MDLLTKRLVAYGLGYVRYLMLTPVIITFAAVVMLALIGAVDLLAPQPDGSIRFEFLQIVPQASTFELGNKEILVAYGWLTLIFYLLSMVTKRFFPGRLILGAIYLICWLFDFLIYLPRQIPGGQKSILFIGLAFAVTTIISYFGYLLVSLISTSLLNSSTMGTDSGSTL